MTRRQKADTNVRLQKDSRERLKALKRFLKASDYSEAVDLAHRRITGSMEPWKAEEPA